MRLQDLLKARKAPTKLACCFCLFATPEEQEWIVDAITVMNGQAVCLDHVYLARDNAFLRKVQYAKERGKSTQQ